MIINQNAVQLTTFANRVSDTQPGSAFPSPTGGQIYAGLLGKSWQWTDAMAQLNSDTSLSTLFGGQYMYVQYRAGSAQANARGQILFWFDRVNFIVTPDPSTGLGDVAGVDCCALAAGQTKGNFGIIQIAGLALVRFRAAVTNAACTPGQIVTVVSDGGVGRGDVTANATTSIVETGT